ncbi:MAG: XRE family transcriptional regulator [Candidatus Alcyoniella australis]|nr:XRE family transcriptional regulator [Candidatus Alcyoniella australis]
MRGRSTPGFIGERLRQIRLARDVTVYSLAGMAGISPQSIYAYESGRSTPTENNLSTLTAILRIPREFFFNPIDDDSKRTIFFRSMTAATQRARERASTFADWSQEVVDYLEMHLDFPPNRFPVFDVPADPFRISFADIEELANKTREAWGLGDGPIGNVVQAIEAMGGIVVKIPLLSDRLDALSVVRPDRPRPILILGAEKTSAVRLRFDACHEKGHWILHRNVPLQKQKEKRYFDLMEKQAHRFAAAFMIPAKAFVDEFVFADLDLFRSMKSRWKCSIAMMIIRSRDLGLIDADRATVLWRNLARRKWKKKEPLDDELPPEKPNILRQGIEMLIEEGIQSRDSIVSSIGLGDSIIEEIAGLPYGSLSKTQGQVSLLRPKMMQKQIRADGENNENGGQVIRFPK